MFEDRFKFLDQVVRKTHATAKISEIVLGRKHWKNLSDEQKKEFVKVFTRLNIATYAHYFKSYSGEILNTYRIKKPDEATCLSELFL